MKPSERISEIANHISGIIDNSDYGLPNQIEILLLRYLTDNDLEIVRKDGIAD